MKKLYSLQLLVSMLLLSFSGLYAQDTVKINFTGMNPHVGQSLHMRLVDKADNSEVDRVMTMISAPDFTLMAGGIMPGSSYNLDFYADMNHNGKYDAPPADHAWRITIDNAEGDTTIAFAHNTTFTDIVWVHRMTLAFTSMNPHLDQDLFFSLKNKNDGQEIERRKFHITDPSFDAVFDNISPDSSYRLDFFADHNSNGRYDEPPTDHAWQILVDSVVGDTVIPFIHNTEFTNFVWKYKLTVIFTGMTPHVGQDLWLYLRDAATEDFIEDTGITPIQSAGFTISLFSIVPDDDYHLDFFADHNNNGAYDVPPVDHAWRIPLMNVQGDTTVTFVHNTEFTDIGLNPTGIDDGKSLPGFSVYPNPVRNELFISSVKGKAEINIYNTSGSLVRNLSLNPSDKEIRVNVSGLKSGVYILELTDDRGSGSRKFFKE